MSDELLAAMNAWWKFLRLDGGESEHIRRLVMAELARQDIFLSYDPETRHFDRLIGDIESLRKIWQ